AIISSRLRVGKQELLQELLAATCQLRRIVRPWMRVFSGSGGFESCPVRTILLAAKPLLALPGLLTHFVCTGSSSPCATQRLAPSRRYFRARASTSMGGSFAGLRTRVS